MGKNFVVGNKTKIFFGVMPGEILALEDVIAPPDSSVTLGAAVTAGATSITVDTLTDPVAAGSVLEFCETGDFVAVTLTEPAIVGATTLTVSALAAGIPKGSRIVFKDHQAIARTTAAAASSATTIAIKPLDGAVADNATGFYFSPADIKKIYTVADAATGATTIGCRAAAVAIADEAFALHKGLLLLQGGTSSDENISSDDTESVVYGDDLGYSDGEITGASWEVSYEFNVLPTDKGYYRLSYAGQNAVGGVKGWIKKVDPLATGAITAEAIEGVCQVADFSKSNPSDDIVTGSCTFRGRGTPTITPAE